MEAEAIRELPGFGSKTEENLRRGLDRLGLSSKERRVPILTAMREARRLVGRLRTLPGVEDAAYCGSLRRFRDTVADLDILMATSEPASVAERLVRMEWVGQVIGSGGTKTSVLTHSGHQVDVRMVPARQWGAAILYFTGSKEHNIRLRRLAIEREWVLSEYALSEAGTGGAVVAEETEEAIYDALGASVDTFPPSARTGARSKQRKPAGCPTWWPDGDLRGDLHVHTDMSGDGDDSLEAMLETAGRDGPGVHSDYRPCRGPGYQRGGSDRDAGPATAVSPSSPGSVPPDAHSPRSRAQHRARTARWTMTTPS